jgi:hypothetical protein
MRRCSCVSGAMWDTVPWGGGTGSARFRGLLAPWGVPRAGPGAPCARLAGGAACCLLWPLPAAGPAARVEPHLEVRNVGVLRFDALGEAKVGDCACGVGAWGGGESMVGGVGPPCKYPSRRRAQRPHWRRPAAVPAAAPLAITPRALPPSRLSSTLRALRSALGWQEWDQGARQVDRCAWAAACCFHRCFCRHARGARNKARPLCLPLVINAPECTTDWLWRCSMARAMSAAVSSTAG